MTRALHELIRAKDAHPNDEDDELEIIDKISGEMRNTAEELRVHHADSEAANDIVAATERIRRDFGRITLRELFALMEAAAVTNNPAIKDTAKDALNRKYPVDDTVPPVVQAVNIRSHKEFNKAMEIVAESNDTEELLPFGLALVNAQAMIDRETGKTFDEVIEESHKKMKQIRQEDDANDKRRQELARREEERKKLEEMHVENDAKFDDAVPFDPFADDEDDSRAA